MRKVLAIILVLAAGTFLVTFVGQYAAFYRWHNASMKLRERHSPADQEAKRDFSGLIESAYPRGQDWTMIRIFSGATLGIALVGFWVERRGRQVASAPGALHRGQP